MKKTSPNPILGNVVISSNQSGRNKDGYFKRPTKRGHPSIAIWKKMSGIIENNIGSIPPPNADFDEIS